MFRWQRKGNTLPGVDRLVGVQGGIIGKKAAAVVLDGLAVTPCIRRNSPSLQPSFSGGTVYRKTVTVPPSSKPICDYYTTKRAVMQTPMSGNAQAEKQRHNKENGFPAGKPSVLFL